MENIISSEYKDLDLIAKNNSNIYRNNQPYPHIVLKNFFKNDFLQEVLNEFPDLSKINDSEKYKSKNEIKFSNNNYSNFSKNTKMFFDFMNSENFLLFLQKLTLVEEKLISDPSLKGGGLHEIKRGGVLKVHTDFNKHPTSGLDRRINVLMYLNKEWKESYGGSLELWDKEMKNAVKKIIPYFNTMVIFSTTDFSNHGHPNPLNCPENSSRKSLALYYFSSGRPSSEIIKNNLKNTTKFKGRFGVSNDIFEKNEKFKNFLRNLKIYQFLKKIEKKYIRRKKN